MSGYEKAGTGTEIPITAWILLNVFVDRMPGRDDALLLSPILEKRNRRRDTKNSGINA